MSQNLPVSGFKACYMSGPVVFSAAKGYPTLVLTMNEMWKMAHYIANS